VSEPSRWSLEQSNSELKSSGVSVARLSGESAISIVDSLVPGIGPFMRFVTLKGVRAVRRRRSKCLRVACDQAGMSRRELKNALRANTETMPLLTQVLWSAGMNGHDETIRHFGVLLGSAAGDARRGDAEAFIRCAHALKSMRDFDLWHVRVLSVLVQIWESKSEPPDGRRRAKEFGVRPLARAAGLHEDDLIARAIDLENAGLALESVLLAESEKGLFFVGFEGGKGFAPTELGVAVVHAARAVQE